MSFIEKIEFTQQQQQSKQSFNYEGYYELTEGKGNEKSQDNKSDSDCHSCKDIIEFDLILNISGIELNVITLKKHKKYVQTQHATNSIYQRELFLNLNHVNTYTKAERQLQNAQ